MSYPPPLVTKHNLPGLVYKLVKALLKPGANTTISANDAERTLTISAQSQGSAGTVSLDPDPVGQFYGRSNAVAVSDGAITGEPFLVRDGAQWRIFYFTTFTGSVLIRTRTASSLEGPWSDSTNVSGLGGTHKFAPLVDKDGVPALVNGSYWGYSVAYDGSLGSKRVRAYSAASLAGPWTNEGEVVGLGHSGTGRDAFNTDTPFALLEDSTVYLWYMAAPSAAQPGIGLNTSILLTTANQPQGPFLYQGVALDANATVGKWDSGWQGGLQVRARPGGGWLALYNAAGANMTAPGDENVGASLIGFAVASNLTGPWARDAGNPYTSLTNLPSGSIEFAHVWRGHVALEGNRWYLFYNTGGGGTEHITFARGSYANIVNAPNFGANGGNIQNLTTLLSALAGSRVELPPGTYRVRVQLNVFASNSGSTPKLDVDTWIRVNGQNVVRTRDFIGSYAYENRDSLIETILTLGERGVVDVAIQVVAGTPSSASWARNLRMVVQAVP